MVLCDGVGGVSFMYLVSLSFYTIPLFLIRRIFYLPVFLKGTVE